MKFYIEPAAFTGLSDVMDVQAIGRWGDNKFVVDAETQDAAAEKLLDLLVKRMGEGQVRPATDDEAQEFADWQREALWCCEFDAQLHKEYLKGLGNEQANQT
jgi:hypothetical protein